MSCCRGHVNRCESVDFSGCQIPNDPCFTTTPKYLELTASVEESFKAVAEELASSLGKLEVERWNGLEFELVKLEAIQAGLRCPNDRQRLSAFIHNYSCCA